jgi:hypothetical protein
VLAKIAANSGNPIMDTLASETLTRGNPVAQVAALWSRLSPANRLVWLHAARLDGGECTCRFADFTADEKTCLMLALENIAAFSREAALSGIPGRPLARTL